MEAGLGRGTLYRHFNTRGDLVAAVLAGELDRMIAFVADRRRSPTLFHDFLQEHAEVGIMAVSAMQELRNETARALLRPLEARAHELYRAVIEDALAAGTIRAPFDTADLLLVTRMVIAAASQEETGEGRTRMISKGIEIVLSGLSSLGSKRKDSS